MSLRGWSKDRSARKVTPPGPSYMSNDQFASYLADLRNNRITRPTGARPLPASKAIPSRRETIDFSPRPSTTVAEDAPVNPQPRSESVASHYRAQSAFSNNSTSSARGRALVQQPYPGVQARDFSPEAPPRILKPSEVVPSATYMERGRRWMEKEDAYALRDAMEDMKLTEEQRQEARLHAAAQKEASELVYQHQHPEAAERPKGPYRYKEHLRKNSYAHARTQSVNNRYSGIDMSMGMRDKTRSVSDGSNSSGASSGRDRVVSGSSTVQETDRQLDNTGSSGEQSHSQKSRKSYGKLSKSDESSSRIRSNGKRNISGEPAGTFSPDQIYEEPESEQLEFSTQPPSDMPAPLRLKPRNPLNRVQFVEEPPRSHSAPIEPTKKLSRSEIHQNPPSQSRNPAYTANAITNPVEIIKSNIQTKDGLEIRGDDILQATRKQLKDRSPKLPTPAVVSDRPGRPIVSFDTNWKPKVEADKKPAEEPRRPRIEHRYNASTESKSLPALPTSKTFQQTPAPTIQLPETPTIQVTESPTISVPSISVSPVAVPTINLPNDPSVPVSTPTISFAEASSSARPLPDPKTMSKRPFPRQHATAPTPRGHWSPAAGSRATASCHQCQLPIEGRVVSVHGLPERFHPQCLICYTCGTPLEALEISPEPSDKRNDRISRIHRREAGEQLEEIEGQTMAEDGDTRQRFYCHLDWHEHFAPRCKHCKTSILGEHVVALGEHWHYGHFFCAECGDPFEQGMTHIEVDGYAWCLRCQTKRTERKAPKCMKCRKGVIGQYVQALGGEWHDECFRCVDCGGGFDDGQIFPRHENGGTIVAACVRCMEKRWKA